MHTYERLWNPDSAECPSITRFRFRSALDVVALAQVDRVVGARGGAEVWHLDHNGRFRCYSPGSTLDSLVDWASDPQPLYRSRADGLAAGNCPTRWLLVESRPGWLIAEARPIEDDVDAFVVLQQHLATVEVELVDAMMFDDAGHWWSMRELATHQLAWPAPARTRSRTCRA